MLAVIALAIVAAPGLPIQDRYVFVVAAILTVFAGAGLFGWLTLAAEHPRRRVWQGAAVAIVIAILASIPWQVTRFEKTFTSARPRDQALTVQQRIQDDLIALTRRHAISTRCGPIGVPTTPRSRCSPSSCMRARPRSVVRVPRARHAARARRRARVFRAFYRLDARNPQIASSGFLRGFRLRARNRSWLVYTRCR